MFVKFALTVTIGFLCDKKNTDFYLYVQYCTFSYGIQFFFFIVFRSSYVIFLEWMSLVVILVLGFYSFRKNNILNEFVILALGKPTCNETLVPYMTIICPNTMIICFLELSFDLLKTS